jgi:multidrug efflux pump subunit AcrB
LPTVRILTVLPGASAEEIETQVSQRIEEAVNTVEGINELRSISGQGRSLVIVTFNLERDIDTAAPMCGSPRTRNASSRWLACGTGFLREIPSPHGAAITHNAM